MIDEGLFAKFDSLEDLPVSEEMLGAYMEGTLSYNECDRIEEILATNTDFASFFNVVSDYDEVTDGLLTSTPDLVEITKFSALSETNVTVYDTNDVPSLVDIFQDMRMVADNFDNEDSFINTDSTMPFETDNVDLDSFNNTNSDIFNTDVSFEDDQFLE